MCKYHENEALEYYCLQCEVCICQICGQIRHKHHTKVEIQRAAEERKVVMGKILNEAKAEIVAFEDKVNKQIELRNESKARMAATESRVTETVEEIIQALRDEEKTVKEKLIAIDEEQEKDHAAQLEKFQMFATELKTSVEQGEEIFQRDIATEILQEENVVFAACKELVSQSQKIQVHIPEDGNYFVNAGNVTARLRELVQQRLDQVVVSDNSQSVAEGQGLKEAEQGVETNFTVTTRDSEGKQFYSEQEQVTVTISSPTGEEEIQITDCKDGNYTVHYKPKSVGRHDVAIDINGWPLTGSPWRVNVKPHQYKVVKSCGSRGKREGEFDEPSSITKNEKTGNIAVADYGNKRVQVFDENLKYLRTIGGGTGSQTGAAVEIGHPRSVAFLRNGDMIIIHGPWGSKEMCVITDDGQFIEQFSKHLINPRSVFVKTDDVGHVIVCDSGDSNIKVLSSDGAELLQSFSAPDSYTIPSYVFYHHDMFFVSYHWPHCVKVFSKEGVFLYNIGSEGSGKPHFKLPRGLVVDAFDNLIVCVNQRLQMFTLDGKFLTSLGQEIQAPCAATICKNGDLLVTDNAQNSVFVFR